MGAKLSSRLIDHVMSSLEAISGVSGRNAIRDKYIFWQFIVLYLIFWLEINFYL
jgi:hypothetical protein